MTIQTPVHVSGGDTTEVATPSAGGLQGETENGAASIGLQQTHKLPQGCGGGEVAKWNGSTWACTAVTAAGQSCPSGQFATGVNASGALVCGSPAAPSLDVKRVDDVQNVPFTQGAVAAATCPTGYKLVGGGWGTRRSATDGADVCDWFDSGPDTYDVGAGGTDPFGGTVYARAYCIKLG